ncbi:alpha/beta fold hydrolase [Sphingobium sufflavum]|uniref:alpha/beta fold hydrolase n=1 Tax=Sphingobium sufflavum TaxID=1129547 RepID=UPI001F1DF01F|nr:alpha/beta hydrolase [Sphingobium sufflavum]MCE7796484.1 alpha/beta fold hydrolase [Sphingobium sufflavum]
MMIRRAFVDTAEGQVHVRMSGARQAGQAPLLLLHQSPASSLTYAEILPLLGADRWAIAVDTPGFGESFRPATQPDIADYARWIMAAVEALGVERFDLMGLFTGAGIASEIAATWPGHVRRLILAGPPLFTSEQQGFFTANAWPARPRVDGSHLLDEWRRVMDRPMPGVPFERRCDAYQEFYRGGGNAIWGEEAIALYPLREILPRIAAPTMVIEPLGIHGDCAGAADLVSDSRLRRIEYLGYAMLQAVPDQVAACVTDFLDWEV